MQVLTEGHSYALQNFESENTSQGLNFIHKKPAEDGTANLITVQDGTTNEEVLKVLINRMEYLQAKFPCVENEIAINNLKSALAVLELRTASRVARGVEGKQLK